MTKTTSIIEINGVGPIVHRTIPLPEDGGVVVLRGHDGAGKSIALDSARLALGAKVRLEHHDDMEKGSIEAFGTRVSVAKQQRRSGLKADELEVSHIEDKYDLSQIVDPGMKSAEANDGVRIKALVQMSGVEIKDENLLALVPDDLPTFTVPSSADPVDKVARFKRLLDGHARQDESDAKLERETEHSLRLAADGVDLTLECNRELLQERLKEAVEENAKLEEQLKAHEQARQDQEQALQSIEKAKQDYDGPTEEEAHQAYTDAMDAYDKAKEVHRQAELELARAESNVHARRTAHHHAQSFDTLVGRFTEVIESELPPQPSTDDLEASREQVSLAEGHVETGLKIRDALDRISKADSYKERAEKLEARAGSIREAAKRTDEVLANAITFDDLKVVGGRLIYTGDDREELFDRLSDGERWTVAIQIGALGVSETNGDSSNLLILPQTAWQDLDPDHRDFINDLAVTEGVNILTAECDRGPLRAVPHGAQDVQAQEELTQAT